MENYSRAKKLIEESQNIYIFPSQDFRADSFPASVALFYALKKLNKRVNLILTEIPKEFHFLAENLQINPLPQDFVISIKEKEAKVSQVFYEKMENELKIYLRTKRGTLNEKNVYFENQNLNPVRDFENKIKAQLVGNISNGVNQNGLFPQSDLLITLGIENLQKLGNNFQENLPLILNIDNQIENENFGKIILKENPSVSLSDIILKLLRTIGEEVPEKDNHLSSPESLLFERILKKIKFKGERNIACALLEKEDFKETNSQASDLSFSLRKLKSEFSPLRDFLLLWQNYNSPLVVKGVFYSSNPEEPGQKILEHFEGKQKGKGILFFLPEEKLVIARDKILKIVE